MEYKFNKDFAKMFALIAEMGKNGFDFDTEIREPKYPDYGKSPSGLQISHITIDEEYAKKWNVHNKDFVVLTVNGELLRPTFYRIGGLNTPNLGKNKYFMLMKHVEAFYDKKITKTTGSDPKHLESRWCIIDDEGNEKVEFKQFEHAYLVKNSCIYSIGSDYYNIETGEHYCHTSSSMESEEFLFLDNHLLYKNDDKTKMGVMKINKKDGTWEVFK